ncbi:MAG: DUF4292 domain-containing protein [Porphyromonadaceae bacterium]|nr:DUF4292 domain-containing protein [Porphyromonadaceae bacterium]
MKIGIDYKPRVLWRIATLLCLISLAVSCGTTRQASVGTPGMEQSEQDRYRATLEQLQRERTGWRAIKATIRGEIEVKGKAFSARINLVATKGQGIRLSVMPFPLVEVLRLWFTPEGVTVVDLINGRYAQESYQVFAQHLGFELSYDQMEALLLGQIFLPGSSRMDDEALRSLTYQPTTAGKATLVGKTQRFRYEFGISEAYELANFVVYGARGTQLFAVRYQDRELLSTQTTMPRTTELTVFREPNGAHTPILGRLQLDWSKIGVVDEPDVEALVPRIRQGYERISLQDIVKLVNAL